MKTQLIQTQKQILSQKQLQSLRILMMDQIQLEEYLYEEYENNPLIEMREYEEDTSSDENDTQWDIEYDGFLSDDYSDGRWQAERTDNSDPFAGIPQKSGPTIWETIRTQMDAGFSDRERAVAEILTGFLGKQGLYESPLDEICMYTGLEGSELLDISSRLGMLEPMGMYCFDMKESLIIQLRGRGDSDIWTEEIIQSYLEELAAGRITKLSRILNVSPEKIRASAEKIRSLNLDPASEFDVNDTAYVIPDIVITVEDGEAKVFIRDPFEEKYVLNEKYVTIATESKDSEEGRFLSDCLDRLRRLEGFMQQRNKTLGKIAGELIKTQYDYFCSAGELSPVTMSEIAAELKLNVSTVTRAVRGKYIQSPRGTELMRGLFSREMSGGNTRETIKQKIRQIIDTEDKASPYSDSRIAEFLSVEGSDVSRRTVAKYREEMGILQAAMRKNI